MKHCCTQKRVPSWLQCRLLVNCIIHPFTVCACFILKVLDSSVDVCLAFLILNQPQPIREGLMAHPPFDSVAPDTSTAARKFEPSLSLPKCL